MSIREIIFFAGGDPESAQTWSNVPKCFIDGLRRKGIVVHPVALTNQRWERLYDNFIRKVLKVLTLWYDEPKYYGYTWLHKWIGNRRIKKAVAAYPKAGYCFFINYAFYNRFSAIPSLLLSDWTSAINLQRRGKAVARFQKRFSLQEKEAIEHAEHVISIFPLCAEEMRQLYPTASIYYLGGNVINDLSGEELSETDVLERKKASRRILFVGKPDRYKESAIKLMKAVELLRKTDEYSDLELDIIGIQRNQLSEVPHFVKCHGFLRKDVADECKEYYDCLKNAKVIVNPTPKWAAYSSMIEAMYFYTPVVVSPFDDFVQEFGETIDFGRYNRVFSEDCIAENIKKLMDSDDFLKTCRQAHEAVKDYTWDRYVDKVLKLCEQ